MFVYLPFQKKLQHSPLISSVLYSYQPPPSSPPGKTITHGGLYCFSQTWSRTHLLSALELGKPSPFTIPALCSGETHAAKVAMSTQHDPEQSGSTNQGSPAHNTITCTAACSEAPYIGSFSTATSLCSSVLGSFNMCAGLSGYVFLLGNCLYL